MGYFVGFIIGSAIGICILAIIFNLAQLSNSLRLLTLTNYFIDTKFATQSRNRLYKCAHDGCNRMFRKYQLLLFESVKGKRKCPHCEGTADIEGFGSRFNPRPSYIENEDSWMASHSDCPKISISGYFKIRKLIKNAERLKKEEAVQQRFEEYNELEPNMDWIRNLQKK